MSKTENYTIEIIYVGGYQDGTVRIWDATLPVLSLVSLLEFEVSAVLAVNPVHTSVSVLVASVFTNKGRVLTYHRLTHTHIPYVVDKRY